MGILRSRFMLFGLLALGICVYVLVVDRFFIPGFAKYVACMGHDDYRLCEQRYLK